MSRRLTAIVEREGDGYVALCPEVDIASRGDTVAAARLVGARGDEVGYVFSRARRTANGSSRARGMRGRDSRSRRREPARA